MGGREVGGLANQLAAHMDIDNPVHRDRVQRFWSSPTIADKQGLKALDLFEQIHEGKVKAVWIMATNPIVSLPDYEYVKAALETCEFVVVSDMTESTDTAAFADVLLPASSWGEKDGMVTNSDRTMSRQRGLVPAPGEAKHDWNAICDVAKKMGFTDAFNYQKPVEIFREHAALSAFENNDERAFDIGALVQIADDEYDQFIPRQWPCRIGETIDKSARPIQNGQFYHADRKAKLLAVNPKKPAQKLTAEFPFRVNSGRMRDQWHTMTRTGIAARLSDHCDEPFVSIHPSDMKSLQIEDGALVKLQSEFGSIIVRSHESDEQVPGQLFVPIHWNRSFASSANVGNLFAWIGDPVSGQPESKHGAVNVQAVEQSWFATLCISEKIDISILDKGCDYWAYTPVDNGYRYRLSGGENTANFYEFWASVVDGGETVVSEYKNTGEIYFAHFTNHSIFALACFSRALEKRTMSLFSELKGKPFIEKKDWSQSVMQKNHQRSEAAGRRICSCFGVGENEIKDAVKSGCDSVEKLGKQLNCGTNCGSCIPELDNLINQFDFVEA
jgi:assimilatory nitrate reductase catalytic subunit